MANQDTQKTIPFQPTHHDRRGDAVGALSPVHLNLIRALARDEAANYLTAKTASAQARAGP